MARAEPSCSAACGNRGPPSMSGRFRLGGCARSVGKMSLEEGQWLDGKYVIVRRIAEGGMSTVYLGVNQRIGKDVAVKVLRPDVARDPDIRERFEREARIVSRIRSEH